MPVILSTSNIIINNGSTNFTLETVKSQLIDSYTKATVGSTSNLTAEPIVETVSRMYPPLNQRRFTADNYTTITSGVSKWTKIAAGHEHSLFLENNGRVYGCGKSEFGQVGNGTAYSGNAIPSPVPILTTHIGTSLPITAISNGAFHSLFLRSDGKVFACGLNNYGQTPNLIDTTHIGTSLPITAISAGEFYSLFLRSDGKVYTGQTTPQVVDTTHIGTSLPITAIDAGGYHSLFLRSDGNVYASGDNNLGEFGNGTTTNSSVPVPILKTNIGTTLPIIEISGGYSFSFFLRSDGNVYASGLNHLYQFGNGGSVRDDETPSPIPTSTAIINVQISLKYGSGLYTVSYSSSTASFEPFRCFNDTTTPNNEGRWAANNYTSTSGIYNKALNLVSGYNGDWLVIKLPVSIKLKWFDIKQISTALNRAPKNFRLYGSTNGSSWSLLADKQNTTYTSLFYTHTDMSQYPSATNQFYNHFGLVVNALVGSTETTLSFDAFFIYGVEQVTPLTITLNSTNKSLRIPTLTSDNYPDPNLNYNLKFPAATFVNNISTSSNIVLQGDYNVNILSSSSSTITRIGGETNISTAQTLSLPTSNITMNYHLLNPTPIYDPIGAQWTYTSANTNVYHMGNVGIGTQTPNYPLRVNGTMFVSSTAYTGSGQTSWVTASDRRIKDNIVKASYEKCMENVNNIELYRFNFKDNTVNTNDYNQLGFIAQEVREVYPKAVEVNMIQDKNGEIPDLLSLNITQIKYTLYGAVKNLLERIDTLEKKLENK